MKHILIAGTALFALSACGPTASEVETAGDITPEVAKKVEEMAETESPAEIGAAFLEENAKEFGVVTTDSGLQYKVAQEGLENGAKPNLGQPIAAHYHGYFIDGEVFDSSYERRRPLTGRSNGFIAGWNESLGDMKVCEARTLYINSDLAYGDDGRGGIPGGATLLFNMQLLAVDGKDEDGKIAYECPEDKVLSGPDDYK